MNAAMILLAGLAAQAAPIDSGAGWRKVFEGQPGVTSVAPASPFPGVDLARPLSECLGFLPLKVDAVAAFNLSVDLGGGRRTDIDVWIGELPIGTRAQESVLAAGSGPVRSDLSCSLSKGGVSFLQIGRYWIGLPTLCRKGYYRGAVSIVLRALQRARKETFPTEFIFAPCGSMKVRAIDTGEFLTRAASVPSNKALQTAGASRRR